MSLRQSPFLSLALRSVSRGLSLPPLLLALTACSADLPVEPTIGPKDAAPSDSGRDVPLGRDTDRLETAGDDASGSGGADGAGDRFETRGSEVDAHGDADVSDETDDADVSDETDDADAGDDDASDDGVSDALGDSLDVGADARLPDASDGGFPGTPVDPRFYRFVRFAVIGDYGTASSDEARVANLVASWNPDFVMTTGDNNYTGSDTGFDDAIGQFYSSFIGNYQGKYGQGSISTRFWPTPGNHDWDVADLGPYADYFTLPGNERYYDIALGLVHLFAVDSDPRELDGTTADSVQARWLQDRLSRSTSCFNLVYFHHPAYSSGPHGSTIDMRWPFEAWGADAVLSGHDHVYERFEVGKIPYFTIGLGGAAPYPFVSTLAESRAQFNSDFAAMRITATRRGLRFEVLDGSGTLVDSLTSRKRCR